MQLNAQVYAWTPDRTDPVRGKSTFAGYGLGLTPVAESVEQNTECVLDLIELSPFQPVVVGVGLQSLTIVNAPPANVEPNATALAQGAWEVPAIRFQFA